MLTITIIVGLLLAFVTGFLCATKSIQMGLRWQIQTSNKQEPSIHSPIAPVADAVKQSKTDEYNKYSKEVMQEWMHGKEVE